MDAIASSLEFELDRYPPPKGLWGEFFNGSFDGLVGELQFERADLGWANLFMKYDRYVKGAYWISSNIGIAILDFSLLLPI